jgi:hypothetical protein
MARSGREERWQRSRAGAFDEHLVKPNPLQVVRRLTWNATTGISPATR